MASNFAQVIGKASIQIKFVWSVPLIGSSSCQAGEVCSGQEEFIPEEAGGIA
jgi:hypothetical protein